MDLQPEAGDRGCQGLRRVRAEASEEVARDIAHGRRQIAFLYGLDGNVEAQDRYMGYRAALAEAGLPYDPALVATDESFSVRPDQPPMSLRPSSTSGRKPRTIRKNCRTSL